MIDDLSSTARTGPTVGQYMTPAPHTISPRRSLAAARARMVETSVRHLPVIDGGRIVGLISERDLLMVESLPGVNPTAVHVDEAMVEEPFTTSADTPLADVVDVMIARKLGSAVVVKGDEVVGVFTTIDALRALQELLSRP